MAFTRARLFGALLATSALGSGFLTAAPAFADTTPGYDCVVDTPNPGSDPSYQPLQVCASFDKATYSSGDTVKLTVSVKNLGTAPASGVSVSPWTETGSDSLTGSPVGPVINYGSGFTLAAGSTAVSEMDGYADEPASGVVTFSAPVYQHLPDGSGSAFGTPVSISSAVTAATGNYSGVVFSDNNANGQPDQGEGIAGAQITLSGPFNGINGNGPQNYTATSDVQGNFQLTGLPAGQYYAQANGPSGWSVQPPGSGQVAVAVGGGSVPDSYLATPSPLPLQATMSFDKSAYQAGQTANITINLTDTGSTTLAGVHAACDIGGSKNAVLGIGAGWTAFTVPAGQTLTLNLSEVVPAYSGTTDGIFSGDCYFAPSFSSGFDGTPRATATATMLPSTGPTTSFALQFVNDDPQYGSDASAFELLDPASQDPVVLDYGAPSPASVTDLPDGTYDIDVADIGSGWQLAPGQTGTLNTADIRQGQTVVVHVVPTYALPAPPTPPTS